MCGNMKFISSVHQDISRVSKANECMRYPVQPNIHVLFCLFSKKIAILHQKNRAVNSNVFHDNRHM